MTDELAQALNQAEKNLRQIEAEHGNNDPRLVQALEDFAKLLRASNRIMDAVDAEWRARSIKNNLAKAEQKQKDSWIDNALGQSTDATSSDTSAPQATSATEPAPVTESQATGPASPATESTAAAASEPPDSIVDTQAKAFTPEDPVQSLTDDIGSAKPVEVTLSKPAAEPNKASKGLSQKLIDERIGTPQYLSSGTTSAPAPAPPATRPASSSLVAVTACPRCKYALTESSKVCNYCQFVLVHPEGGNAGFWLRFGAWLIDYVVLYMVESIVGVVCLIVAMCISGASAGKELSDMGTVVVLIVMVGLPLISAFFIEWFYEAFMTASKHQGTLGKICVGIKVTDMDGNRISFWRATARHFAKILSGLILFIGYFMVGWTEKKQALHDLIAGTLVVRKAQPEQDTKPKY